MDLFEVTKVAPDIIRIEFREPAIVHMPIRNVTAGEIQVGGVFERINVVNVSNDTNAIFTLEKTVPWPNDTYVRFSGNSQGKTDISTSGVTKSVSGNTFQLSIHNGVGFQLYNGAHGPNYVANSCFVCKLSANTGNLRRYVVGMNLDKVKDADYFPGPRGNATAAMILSEYALTGKTLSFVGLQKDVWDVGSTGVSTTTDDERYVVSFSYSIYLKANSNVTAGSYTLTLPPNLNATPNITFTINEKTTRCSSIAVNQIGYKPDDESKIGYLAQYVPQYDNYGSVPFLTDYSITNYHLVNESGTIVWSANTAPVLRLDNVTVEDGAALDSISADPLRYGVNVANVIPGNPTTIITSTAHNLANNDVVSILYVRGIHLSGADNLYYQSGVAATVVSANTLTVPVNTTGATAYISGGKVTKYYSVNYAGMHTYLLDFSTAVLPEGTYRLYIPGFGVSDPIYFTNSAWAQVAKIGMKALYHQAMGLAKDGRFGVTHAPSARVGYQGVNRILYTPIPHIFWGEQAGGRLMAIPAADRFISGTSNVYGGMMDAGDWDRLPQMGHLAELAQLMGPPVLIPKASRYLNSNFPASKDTIGGPFTKKLNCDWLDAAIWYVDAFRRVQGSDGGILSAVQYNVGISNFPVRLGPQPTYETNTGWLAMAPDLISTVSYAYAAALVAWHLKEFGNLTLSNLYLASAELAHGYYKTIIAQTHEADYHDDARLLYTEQPVWMMAPNPLTFAVDPIGILPLTSASGKQWVANNFTGGFAALNGNTYCLRNGAISGTFSRVTTNCTITITAHGLSTGQSPFLDFQSSGPVDNAYQVTVLSANTFTVNVANSGLTSGTVSLHGTNFIHVYDSSNTTAVNAVSFGAYTNDTGKFTPTTVAFRALWDVRANAQGFTNAESLKNIAAAAGVLYNLTGNTTYKTLHESDDDMAGWRCWGRYIYGLANGANQVKVNTMYASANSSANTGMLANNKINDRSFTYFENSGAMGEFGSSTQPVSHYAAFAMISHRQAYLDRRNNGDTHAQAKANAGVKKYIKALQDAYAFLLGANSIKMCWGAGHGARWPASCLHIDKQANGNAIYAGLYPYWVTNPAAYNNNPNVYNFGDTPLRDTGATTQGGIPNIDTELIPHRYSRPRMVSYIPIPWLVTHTEYNLSKFYYLVGIALYLQYWEGGIVQPDGIMRTVVQTI